MNIGFTGTRDGMTESQIKQLTKELIKAQADGHHTFFHHGDCIGADEQAHQVAIKLGCYIIVHPPTDDRQAVGCKGSKILRLAPLPYLERNKEIVEIAHIMLAAPKSMKEELRSGTWSTIRYAKKKGKELVILKP